MKLSIQKRFDARVNKTATCWLWTGPLNEFGYGRMIANKKAELAHRLSYMLHAGPIEAGKEICHTCDIRNCVNPAHLFQGSHLENVQDMVTKGRSHNQQKTHCDNGHEFTETNTYSRPDGSRACRTCKRETNRSQYHKHITPERKAERAAKERARRAKKK